MSKTYIYNVQFVFDYAVLITTITSDSEDDDVIEKEALGWLEHNGFAIKNTINDIIIEEIEQ